MMLLRRGETSQSVPALRIHFAFGKCRVGEVTLHLGLPVTLEGGEKLLIVGTCHHLRLFYFKYALTGSIRSSRTFASSIRIFAPCPVDASPHIGCLSSLHNLRPTGTACVRCHRLRNFVRYVSLWDRER